MTTLADAYALVALPTAEPAGERERTLLREEPCGITALNLAEAVDMLGVVLLPTRGGTGR